MMTQKRELLVVVKRGVRADVSERTGPPFEGNDIRQWADSMTWPEIRQKCIDFLSDLEDDELDEYFSEYFSESDTRVEIDE